MKPSKSVRFGCIIAVPLLAFSNSSLEKTPVQTPTAKAPPDSAAFMSFGYKPELNNQLGFGLLLVEFPGNQTAPKQYTGGLIIAH